MDRLEALLAKDLLLLATNSGLAQVSGCPGFSALDRHVWREFGLQPPHSSGMHELDI
jgi:hypothetical protein